MKNAISNNKYPVAQSESYSENCFVRSREAKYSVVKHRIRTMCPDTDRTNNTIQRCSSRNHLKSKSVKGVASNLGQINTGMVQTESIIKVGANKMEKCVYTSDRCSLNLNNTTPIFRTSVKTETSLDKIKKDVIVNRIEGFKSFSSCAERQEKIAKLRKELSLLITVPDKEQTNEYVKSEYSNLSKSANMFVYNIYDAKFNQKLLESIVSEKNCLSGKCEITEQFEENETCK